MLNFAKPTAKRLTFEVVGPRRQHVRRQPRLQGARRDRHVRRRAADDLRRKWRPDRRRPARFAAAGRDACPTSAWSTRPNLGMMGNIAFERAEGPALQVDDHPPRRRPRRRIRDAADDRRRRPRRQHQHAEDHPQRCSRKVPLQVQCDDQGSVPRADRDRQVVPRPAPDDRATCFRARSRTCPASRPRSAASRKSSSRRRRR